MGRIITLLTDFGVVDEYVGVMKGVILARAPETTIVDISHAIPRHDVFRAGILLQSACRYFPMGTVHLVVVDPGVGTDRRLVLLNVDGHLFLGPDNGVFSPVLESGNLEEAYELRCEQYYLQAVGTTFHGRDIMAPVAARLAAGLEPSEVGPPIKPGSLVTRAVSEPIVDPGEGKITGQVVAVDGFGNLQTNIGGRSLAMLAAGKGRRLAVTIRNWTIAGVAESYAQAAPGELLAVIGSRGFLEIAVNRGSAAAVLDAAMGDDVVVEGRKA